VNALLAGIRGAFPPVDFRAVFFMALPGVGMDLEPPASEGRPPAAGFASDIVFAMAERGDGDARDGEVKLAWSVDCQSRGRTIRYEWTRGGSNQSRAYARSTT
jgi:hypothetical protein